MSLGVLPLWRNIPVKTKECTKCGKRKNVEDFRFRSVRSNSRLPICRECYNAYFRNYFKNKTNLEKQSRRVKRRRNVIQWNLKEYKLRIGCQICGYNRCSSALHFHHKDRTTKSVNLAYAKFASKNTVQLEISKCALLCSICHAEVEEKLKELPMDLPPLPELTPSDITTVMWNEYESLAA